MADVCVCVCVARVNKVRQREWFQNVLRYETVLLEKYARMKSVDCSFSLSHTFSCFKAIFKTIHRVLLDCIQVNVQQWKKESDERVRKRANKQQYTFNLILWNIKENYFR